MGCGKRGPAAAGGGGGEGSVQLVRNPASATVSMPLALSSASRVVPGKASRPFLPCVNEADGKAHGMHTARAALPCSIAVYCAHTTPACLHRLP